MAGDTILYVSDHAVSASVLAAIKAAGYDVVSADRTNQALALLFVMRSAAAVVLDLGSTEEIGYELARELRAIHSGVPILLRCCEHIDHRPPWVDAYVSAGEPLERLASLLRKMLNGELAVQDGPPSDSPQTRLNY
jgi:response regulator RpfG family c-di-GMP phosphodiesterase